MSKTLHRIFVAIALSALTPFAPGSADSYPTKPITIMPLLAAGTGLDITVRLYAEQLSQAFGKPVVSICCGAESGAARDRSGHSGPRRRRRFTGLPHGRCLGQLADTPPR